MKTALTLSLTAWAAFLAFSQDAPAAVDIASVISDIRGQYDTYELDVHDLSAAMKITTPDGEWFEKKVFIKGALTRIDTTAPASELLSNPEEMAELRTTYVGDGREAWIVRAFKNPERVSSSEFDELPIFSRWWKELTNKAVVQDEARLDDADTFQIVLEPQAGSRYQKLWVQKQTWLLLKAEGVSDSGKTLVWRFTDHRPVTEHFSLPYKIDLFENGLPVKSFTLTSVQLNTGLPESIFQVPAELSKSGVGP